MSTEVALRMRENGRNDRAGNNEGGGPWWRLVEGGSEVEVEKKGNWWSD